ncbi:hypothetical protein AVEN_75657-1 [Araneus ventricosus]|uniref:Uncharacterized protein n=1 Tax=Araneus ventricosus TaxID=182803 RepID=A0A4Y2D6V9_ARAVE|nr:hypothetical protein AVEN_75657-1 [Araneus ventricosus]
MISIEDPVRPSAVEAIRNFRNAGIKAFGWPIVVFSLCQEKNPTSFMRLQPPPPPLLFSTASFSDVTGDGSAVYRYSAAAGGPHRH